MLILNCIKKTFQRNSKWEKCNFQIDQNVQVRNWMLWYDYCPRVIAVDKTIVIPDEKCWPHQTHAA